MIRYEADGRAARATSDEPLTTGSVGVPVVVELSEDYEGLQVTVVFDCGGRSADVPLLGQAAFVPSQLLRHEGNRLRMGAWGALPDGTVVIPTVWADVGTVREGVEPSGIDPAQPAPSWAAQVQAWAESAAATAASLAEAAARGDFDGADGADGYSPTASVERNASGATITVTDATGTTTAEVLDGVDADNLSPFFSYGQSTGEADPYWKAFRPYTQIGVSCSFVGDGWVRVVANDWQHSSGTVDALFVAPRDSAAVSGSGAYTLLVEAKGLTATGGYRYARVSVDRSGCQLVAQQGASYHDFDGDGEWRATLVAGGGSGSLVGITFEMPRASTATASFRVSLWEGEYGGPWRPCRLWWVERSVDALSADVAGLSETVAGLAADASARNLTPFFSCDYRDEHDEAPYWLEYDVADGAYVTKDVDGWLVLNAGYNDSDEPWTVLRVTPRSDYVSYRRDDDSHVIPTYVRSAGARYTLLVEVREVTESEVTVSVKASGLGDADALSPAEGSTGSVSIDPEGSGRMRSWRIPLVSSSDLDPNDQQRRALFAIEVAEPSRSPYGAYIAIRLSLWEGDYEGPYRHCAWWAEELAATADAETRRLAARVAALEGGS